jgi:hypothetical protein
MKLSNLKQVELREVWKHEATDFTNWLAKDENLSLLSDEIGIEISLIRTEASVGKFNVDILAEEEITGRKIVIENQLESTDHDHLGKIITYSSGFEAEITIWIVKDVRDEHKQAVDWLNEHTDEHANFFIIKMEVWQIEDSPYAPKFQVISQPNDWAKAVKTGRSEEGLSDTKLMQFEFWTEFRKFGLERNPKLRFRKPFPQHWYDISVGIPKSYVTLIVDTRNNQLRSEFYIPDDKDLYRKFEANKEIIDNEMSCDLEWEFLEGRKASRIKTVKDVDVSRSNQWEVYFSWLLDRTEEIQRVFSKYV